MASPKERRKRRRIDVALPIRIEYNKEKISAETENISVLGTYIQTGKEIPIGTTLGIEIEIAKAGKVKQISCAGVAFRCRPSGSSEPKKQYGTGIFFRSFLENGEKELSAYIDYILSEEKKIGKIYMRKIRQKQLKQKGGKG